MQAGKNPATFRNAVPTMALSISEDQEELAPMGGRGYVPRPAGIGGVQPTGRPLEDAHAHDMVGTRATCPDKVQGWKGERTPGGKCVSFCRRWRAWPNAPGDLHPRPGDDAAVAAVVYLQCHDAGFKVAPCGQGRITHCRSPVIWGWPCMALGIRSPALPAPEPAPTFPGRINTNPD